MTAFLSRGKRLFALEMINHQNDSFGVDIEALMTRIRTKLAGSTMSARELEASEEVTELTTLIEKRLGLKVSFTTESILAAILPFYSNKNHILLDEWFRGNVDIKEQDAILNRSNGKKGTVNTKRGYVSGIFSEYINPLFFNFRGIFFTYNLTPAEATGVLLHELGHGFAACEYSDRLSSTNQVLEDVAKRIGSKKKDSADYVYRELSVVNPKVTEEQVDALINGNKVIAGATWFKVVIGSVEAQLQNGKYDDTSFEQLADGFASRFGYGRFVLSGLDKLHIAAGYPEKFAGFRMLAFLTETLFFGLCVWATFFFLPIISFPLALLVTVLFYYIFKGTGSGYTDMTYDEVKARYKRLRNDTVDMLKDQSLPKKRLVEILDNIYAMDTIIKETGTYTGPWRLMADFVFSANRSAAEAVAQQKLLEELAFNDLFVKSAQLKTHA